MDGSSIDLVMCTNVYKKNLFFIDHKFNRDTVTHCNGYRIEPLQLTMQWMKTKGWMKRIHLHELQTFFILRDDVWMLFEKFPGSSQVTFGKDNCEIIHF